MNAENDALDELRFVYLESNKQKVSHIIYNFNKACIFGIAYSIFFLICQIQKHIAIYYADDQTPSPSVSSSQIDHYSFDLHTLYTFLTLMLAFLMVFKAWKIKTQPNFKEFGLDKFKRGFTEIEDYKYLNLLLILFSLVRFFQRGILYIWLELISSIIGIFLGKTMENYKTNIIFYSTQLKQETEPEP